MMSSVPKNDLASESEETLASEKENDLTSEKCGSESPNKNQDSYSKSKWSKDMSKDVAEEYASSLADLTVNSKPLINMLTMLADDYIAHAPLIVKAVEAHLQKVRGDIKLPVLYLIDSIVKNVGKEYISLFTQNIVSTFCSVFEKVDEKVRAQMFKLRQTWNEVFPTKKLYALDARVNAIDPAWPITATPPTSIHVNPKFLQGTSPNSPVSPPDVASPNINDGVMREQLLKKQKELLELQKRKVELELLQTKAILEEEQKKLEAHTANFKSESSSSKTTKRPHKTEGHFARQGERIYITSHIPNQGDSVQQPNPSVLPDSEGRDIKCSGSNPQMSESLPKLTVLSQPGPSTISASVRSRDPRIRMKEKMNEKKAKVIISDPSEKVPVAKVNILPTSEPSPKTKKKKKSVSRKKEKGIDLSSQRRYCTKLDKSDKQSLASTLESSGKKTDVKKEFKAEKVQKPNTDKVKSARRALPEENVTASLEKSFNSKLIDKGKKNKGDEVDNKNLTINSDLSEKCVKRDEINSEQNLNTGRKACKYSGPSDPKYSSAINTSVLKADKRKIGNVVNIPKRPCVAGSSKVFPDTLDPKIKTSSHGKYQKYNRESGDVSLSSESAISPLPSVSESCTTVRPHSTQHADNFVIKASISANQKLKKKKGKDVDLRLFLAPAKRRIPGTESGISTKKSKAEIMDTLFGNEDVDLRTLPPQPPTPPPPIISDSSVTPDPEKSWANYKQNKIDPKSSEDKRRRSNIDRLGRPLLYNLEKGEGGDDDKSSRQCESDRSHTNCNLIIKQAEEQLNAGNITFAQYNRMLKEVITMNEERKLQEAQRKDELEGSSISNTTTKESEITDSITCPSDDPHDIGPEIKNVKDAPFYTSETDLTAASHDDLTVSSVKKPVEEDENKKFVKRFEDNTTMSMQMADVSEPEPRKTIEHKAEMRHRHFKPEPKRKADCDRKSFPVPFESSAPRKWFLPRNVQSPMLMHDIGPFPPRWNRPVPPRPIFEHDNAQYSGFSGVRSLLPKSHFPVIQRDVPPADPLVLEMIKNDTMHTINIDGVPREVRFYGEVAIIMLSWDDPREITFQPGSRRIWIGDREPYILNFNSLYRDILLNGIRTKIRLGAPTRELFIDGEFYEALFGGPPIQVMIAGRLHSIKLEGPLPQVRIGNIKRTDLVAGKINLIVDAKHMFPLFLDAKPQRFEIDGVPYILRFVEALQTVVINGRPFKIEFGGLPVPIFFHGKKHFLRLSVLPAGIRPGYISIINMEGGRLPTPPPQALPQHSVITTNTALAMDGASTNMGRNHNCEVNQNIPLPADVLPTQQSQGQSGNEHPLEVLTSLMPTAMAPCSGQNYTVEQASEDRTSSSTSSDINVGELFRKLVAIGIVPPVKEKEQPVRDSNSVRPVNFSQPDTLKVKQPNLIKRLYSGIQCSSCGVRFSPEQTIKYSQHLDWHFRQNRRDRDSARIAQSRRWYYDISDWIQYQEIEDLEERAQSWFEIQDGKVPSETEEIKEEEPSVVAGPDNENVSCDICRDKFEQFYNEEKEEWHLRRAIRIDNKVFHPLCYHDFKESQVRINSESEETEKYERDSISSKQEVLETIELDDTTVEEESSPILFDELLPFDTENKENSEIEIISDLEEDPQPEKSPSISDLLSEKISISNDDSKPLVESEDDDIIQVEVLERKIESYEIPDEEDDDEQCDNMISSSVEINPSNVNEDLGFLDIDFSKIKVKKEKEDIDIPEPVVDTTHTSLTTSIDGNVELEEAPQIVIPGKIIINISKGKSSKDTKSASPPEDNTEPSPSSTEQTSAMTLVEQMQPPPPGEELYPAHVKPRIVGTKLTDYPVVNKGSELSGLCNIM